MNVKFIKLPAAMVCLALACQTGARADHAVVIGVNQYPNLNGATLNGCVPDAKLMAETLGKFKFNVTLLTDEKATKSGIIEALNTAKASNKPNERFVFYFAGHGTRSSDGKAVLLPTDSEEKAETNDIKSEELYSHVNEVPARTRTVLLDSCFSGGMSRSVLGMKRNRANLKTRFYNRPTANSKSLNAGVSNPPQDTQTDSVIAGDSGATKAASTVCYFTATRKNEQAGEDLFPDGSRHGVFTYYLVQRLNSGADVWGNVQKTVSSSVSDWMDDTQHPTLTPDFVGVELFGSTASSTTTTTTTTNSTPNTTTTTTTTTTPTVTPVVVKPTPVPTKIKPAPAPKPSSIWETYNSDNPNPDKVRVRLDPDKTSFAVEEELKFSIDANENGFLVILERGTSGNINLIYPQSSNVADAAVKAGWSLTVPADKNQVYKPDSPGTERIKAILFTSKAMAAALLSKFPKTRSLTRAASKDLKLSVKISNENRPPVAPASTTVPYYTSDIIFEVVSEESDE